MVVALSKAQRGSHSQALSFSARKQDGAGLIQHQQPTLPLKRRQHEWQCANSLIVRSAEGARIPTFLPLAVYQHFLSIHSASRGKSKQLLERETALHSPRTICTVLTGREIWRSPQASQALAGSVPAIPPPINVRHDQPI